MDIDRFGPALGPKMRTTGPEDALASVRTRHPDAWCEGSTGAERTYVLTDQHGVRRVVGHHWSPSCGKEGKPWWLRISPTIEDGPEFAL